VLSYHFDLVSVISCGLFEVAADCHSKRTDPGRQCCPVTLAAGNGCTLGQGRVVGVTHPDLRRSLRASPYAFAPNISADGEGGVDISVDRCFLLVGLERSCSSGACQTRTNFLYCNSTETMAEMGAVVYQIKGLRPLPRARLRLCPPGRLWPHCPPAFFLCHTVL
jgi:hypothetical protein